MFIIHPCDVPQALLSFILQACHGLPCFGHSAVVFGMESHFKTLALFGGRRHVIGDEVSETTLILLSKKILKALYNEFDIEIQIREGMVGQWREW